MWALPAYARGLAACVCGWVVMGASGEALPRQGIHAGGWSAPAGPTACLPGAALCNGAPPCAGFPGCFRCPLFLQPSDIPLDVSSPPLVRGLLQQVEGSAMGKCLWQTKKKKKKPDCSLCSPKYLSREVFAPGEIWGSLHALLCPQLLTERLGFQGGWRAPALAPLRNLFLKRLGGAGVVRGKAGLGCG